MTEKPSPGALHPADESPKLMYCHRYIGDVPNLTGSATLVQADGGRNTRSEDTDTDQEVDDADD